MYNYLQKQFPALKMNQKQSNAHQNTK